jgi:thiosulfate/3-mercaptopyruvate sulfurtransferase
MVTMSYTTLISVESLHENLDNPAFVIVDCRFELADKEAGQRAYRAGHIPGALFADVEKDLSGPPLTDRGRHPMPSAEALRSLFGRLGIGAEKQVVAYDASGGAMAVRLWWLLRYMGHPAVAVLDGGWPRWLAAGLPSTDKFWEAKAATFTGEAHREWLVLVDELGDHSFLVDCRDPARYRGEIEPIDPVAGHIPGAVNYPYGRNLGPDGRFLPADRLRRQLSEIVAQRPGEEPIFYCGSGVSACHNLLAMAHAGLPGGKLYAGSWSEWSADPRRAVARGEE